MRELNSKLPRHQLLELTGSSVRSPQPKVPTRPAAGLAFCSRLLLGSLGVLVLPGDKQEGDTLPGELLEEDGVEGALSSPAMDRIYPLSFPCCWDPEVVAVISS